MQGRPPPPYWAVDPDRWDIYKLNFNGRKVDVNFDIGKEETVQHLEEAIRQRGNRLYIGFTFYDPKIEQDFDEEVVKLAQFGKNICHSCVWFGEHVTTMVVGSQRGVIMAESPANYGRWELVSLQFANVPLAFRIGVDIVAKCNWKGIHYEPQTWQVLWHVLTGLFVPGGSRGGEDTGIGADYNPEKPETWTRGVHCSQLVLLFLKRCVLRGALPIPPQQRDRFLRIHSFTCLPARLRALLTEIWGVGPGEFRDYQHITEEVRQRRYPRYCAREWTRQLK
jgi:hypothetical protein